ncbi:MAG: hypothetical protein A4E20_11925 [Nitrospira sp. SG-bin2]|uniref:hypothetical protein n=1 Tax=Nitrospira cf. moscoviensis SBR1015 TaxID=96242 RepID=UPI000A0E10A6|nr:hypothetical protein [Nitrospira cf. moscoviensis SBR1015]OQW34135.1 MAG: hypothetical protein A4E20_11925 [Nitrospira sp. SG-bin2]
MPKPVAKHIADILKTYELDPKEALWDCHGTFVMYHRYCEIIAAKAGIRFDAPQIVEAKTADKIAVICVTGHMGVERSEWSFGEAAPSNNKNAYPYAMAEKRAKDRVILKLVGLAGFVYSEEEADDFKEAKPQTEPAPKSAGVINLIYPDGEAHPVETVTAWLDMFQNAADHYGYEKMWNENELAMASIQAKAVKQGRQDIVDRIAMIYSRAKEAA